MHETSLIGKRYRIGHHLGQGGMGVVYTATDRLTEDVVALKRVLITPDQSDTLILGDNDDYFSSVATEFRTLAGLRHPHIVRVLDYGFTFEDGTPQPYFTMEFLPEARPITKAAMDEPLSTQVRLLNEMLLALAYLHRHGVLHRDLKPDNVLVDKDKRVKVLDFGLASHTVKSASKITAGAAGTVTHMAPELFRDDPASVRSDLYAAGLIIYEVLTGSYPFNQKNLMVLLNDILNKLPDLSMLEDEVGMLIENLLAKDPAQRPDDAQAVLRALCAATNQPVPAESILIRESFLQASRFVGRRAEMEQLQSALIPLFKPGKGPQAQVYLIGGESGVGKSRLLDELRKRALVKGALVWRGQGVAEGGLPYQLWRDIAPELVLSTSLSELEASILKALVPGIRGLLGRDVADAPELTGAAAQQRLVLTLIDLLKRQSQPVVLLLEDLQWAAESLAPIKQILTVREQLPRLLVLGTYRDDERPHLPDELSGAQPIKLPRLDEAAMAELSESMLGEVGTQPEILNLLKQETEGNAFFMVETVRALAEDAGALSEIGKAGIPQRVFAGGIQEVVRRRLSRVMEWARPLLKQAAVVGRQLDLRVLAFNSDGKADKSSDPDLDGWLSVCTEAAVLEVVDGRWRFAHDKLRETILADLREDERRKLNRAAALAIEAVYPKDESYFEVLLEHWRAAGEAEKEIRYLLPVLRDLLERRAEIQQALHLANYGLTLPVVNDGTRVILLNDLSEAFEHEGDYQQARQLAEQALQIAEQHANQEGITDSLIALGNLANKQGDIEGARNYLQRSLTIAQGLDNRSRVAMNLITLGTVAYHQGDFKAAEDYYRQGLAVVQEIGDQRLVALGMNGIANVASDLGDFSSAKDYYLQSLAIRRGIGDRAGIGDTLNNLGILAFNQDDLAASRDYLEQGLEIDRQIGDRPGIAYGLNNLGSLAQEMGDHQKAEDYFRQALALFRASDDRPSVVLALGNLGNLLLVQNQRGAAIPHLREALALGYEIGAIPWIMNPIIGLTWRYIYADDLSRAAEIVGLVTAHPSTLVDTKTGDLAVLRRQLETLMPADAFAAAMERGKALDLNTVVKELLAEGKDDL